MPSRGQQQSAWVAHCVLWSGTIRAINVKAAGHPPAPSQPSDRRGVADRIPDTALQVFYLHIFTIGIFTLKFNDNRFSHLTA